MSVPPMNPHPARLRIGELSRRTGVRTDTLRAWERRYGLLRPERSDGGFRLYGPEDEQRVIRMKTLIDSGVSAAEAARLALESSAPGVAAATGGAAVWALDVQAERLRLALERFEEAEANTLLDEALAGLTVETVADHIVLPAMRAIGERWESGEVSVAQEHFATGVLRGRMLSVARNWGAGSALVHCSPVLPARTTTWAWSSSGSCFGPAAGGSPTSVRTPRSRRSPRRRSSPRMLWCSPR